MIGADFLAPGRLWWLLAVAALAAGYVATQLWGRRATVRFTQVELLDRVAPSRPGWRRQPGRAGATRSSRSTWVKRTVARRPHSWVAT